MLAATLKDAAEAGKLMFPAYVSSKIDGVRCVTDRAGEAVSRNGMAFANRFVAEEFRKANIPLLDGELGLGSPLDPAFFNRTSGFLRREDDDFTQGVLDYYVFDMIGEGGYEERFINKLPELEAKFAEVNSTSRINFFVHDQRKVLDEESLQGWEEVYHQRGWEGIMGRHNILAPYKYGRASIKSQELVKCKRFVDDEAVITGFVEAMENNNVPEKDAWGRTKRSSHQENKTGLGMAGVILCSCSNFDGEVRIGTGIGLTHELKREMWNNQAAYIGRTITFQYQAGADYAKTRFGSYKGFRDDGI